MFLITSATSPSRLNANTVAIAFPAYRRKGNEMAILFKRGEKYYLSFYSKTRTPIRKQIPLKTRSRRTAEKLQIKLEDETALGLFDPWSNASGVSAKSIPNSLGSATEAFLVTRLNLSKQSVQKYRSVLGQLVSFLGPELFEPPRVCWRLQSLRTWSYETIKEIRS